MESKISPTVEGGLLTAITVILGLASTFLPVIGLFLEFFCAVPIVILTVRQGTKKGFLALIASFLILTMFIGPLLSMRIALSFGICGLTLGYCVKKNFSTIKCFLVTFSTAIIAQVIAIAILTFAMGINLMETEIASVRESFEEVFKMYESAGIPQQEIEQIKAQVEPALKTLSYLMPLILTLLALVNSAICYVTSGWIFKKLRMKFIEPLPNFAAWRFPKIFLYIAAFASIGLYWGGTRDWDLIYTISINAAYITGIVFLIQGFSVLSAIADIYNVSTFWRRVFFILIIFNKLLITVVTVTGFMDMIFDFRKSGKSGESED